MPSSNIPFTPPASPSFTTSSSAPSPKKRKTASATKKQDGADGKVAWTGEHTRIVQINLLSAAYAARSAIYACPGLAGQVDEHGSDRIHKKIMAELKSLAAHMQLRLRAADIKAIVGSPV